MTRIEPNADKRLNPASGRLLLFSSMMGLILLATIVAQEASPEKPTPPSKKTATGLEVTVFEVSPAEDFDSVNRVPMFRMGSCPPGSAMSGMKIEGNPGKDVVIVRLGLKFPSNYQQTDFPIPLLLDVDGKKYSSRNMVQPSPQLVPRLKTTGEQLKCEIPFELPVATRVSKLQYENVVFDVKVKSRSQQ